jgi:hypothetical protein
MPEPADARKAHDGERQRHEHRASHAALSLTGRRVARQAGRQLDLIHAEQAQREEHEQRAQGVVHDRVHAQLAEERQQRDRGDRQHDDDGAAVNRGHEEWPMVLLLRLLEEEADRDRDHRKDARRDQRDGAPEYAGQHEGKQP